MQDVQQLKDQQLVNALKVWAQNDRKNSVYLLFQILYDVGRQDVFEKQKVQQKIREQAINSQK